MVALTFGVFVPSPGTNPQVGFRRPERWVSADEVGATSSGLVHRHGRGAVPGGEEAIATVPVTASEMTLAAWLIVKGFKSPAAPTSGARRLAVDNPLPVHV